MTLIEVVIGLVLFSAIAAGILILSTSTKTFTREANSATQLNSYTNLAAQVAQQGLNPTAVTNFGAQVLTASGSTTGTAVTAASANDKRSITFIRNKVANFETGASSSPSGASESLGGVTTTTAMVYQSPASAAQTAKGIGFGYAVNSAAAAELAAPLQLAAPTPNYSGDLTAAPFPLNDIFNITTGLNPPGTEYHYTTDGSTPTASSPIWNNNPSWTSSTFPNQVTIVAFNADPQYSPSIPATASYTYSLGIAYARADGRASNIYGFTLSDLTAPASTGIILTSNVPGATIKYTLNGASPATAGVTYLGAFVPGQSLFTPNVPLEAVVVSADPRYTSSAVASFTLTPTAVPLDSPSFITSNLAPILEGDSISLTVDSLNASPRTSLNAAPTVNSSSATSLILIP